MNILRTLNKPPAQLGGPDTIAMTARDTARNNQNGPATLPKMTFLIPYFCVPLWGTSRNRAVMTRSR